MADDLHERPMRLALALASRAAERGETPVGAVIIRAGETIGEGHERTRERRDPTAHAEVEAIRDAVHRLGRADLAGCALYTTVEPCVLCGYVIRRTGIVLVAYGIRAGQAGAVTSRYAILEDVELEGWPAPPTIIQGVLAVQCLAVLEIRSRS